MVGQCDTLRDRYEDLERRKRSEAEGYQNDVRLLQQKMRRIETQLGRAAISKAKGKIKVTERLWTHNSRDSDEGKMTCCHRMGM